MLQHVVVYLTLSSFVLLKLCGATDIPCTVTQDGELTVYSVPEFNGTDCDFRWLNMTRHVLANNEEETVGQGVVRKTNRTLVTDKCSKQITYFRICFPEGVQHMANCTSNCSGNAAVPYEGGEVRRWIIPTAVASVVLLVLLCCIFKDRISRCRYAPVKTQDSMIV